MRRSLPPPKIEERLEREARERMEARAKEASASDEAKITMFKESVLKPGLVAAGDKYELIGARGEDGPALVFEVIEQYYSQHGTVCTWQDAADHVEKHLEAEARKLLSLKRFQ